MKTKSNLCLCLFCLFCVRVTFLGEADFIKNDYFIIEISDHSDYFNYQTLAKKALLIIRSKSHSYLERKIFQSYHFFSFVDKKYTLNGINTL